MKPKFRIWDKTEKCMMDWDSICDNGEYLNELLSDNYEWMLSTGLHDRNGKEIWEGDIIKSIVYLKPLKVGFQYGTFTKEFADGGGFISWLAEEDKKCEVIGNIYENPELLNQSIERM